MTALRRCSVCGTTTWSFAPLPQQYATEWRRAGFRYSADDFETLNLREYSCRSCSASDRDRLYALWIDRGRERGGSLLDVGPSRPLQPFLRSRFEYVTFDSAGDADVIGDVQALPFADAAFDRSLCSRVLGARWPNVPACLAELRRVLNPGGWGIIMVPSSSRRLRSTRVFQAVEAEAWRRFSQGDHVRLYDRGGFLARPAKPGFWRRNYGVPAPSTGLRYGLARGTTLMSFGSR